MSVCEWGLLGSLPPTKRAAFITKAATFRLVGSISVTIHLNCKELCSITLHKIYIEYLLEDKSL